MDNYAKVASSIQQEPEIDPKLRRSGLSQRPTNVLAEINYKKFKHVHKPTSFQEYQR